MPGRCTIPAGRGVYWRRVRDLNPRWGISPHTISSRAPSEQSFASCRDIGEVISIEVGSNGVRSVTKPALHGFDRNATQNRRRRDRVTQAVEGNGRELQALQERPVRSIDLIRGSLAEKPGECQRLMVQTVRHHRRKRNTPHRCTRLDRGKRKPIKTLHLYGQNAISREVTAARGKRFPPAQTTHTKRKKKGKQSLD